MARTKLIAANWKMYKTPQQAEEFMRVFLTMLEPHPKAAIVICPPFPALHAVAGVAGTRVGVGAQNLHWEKEGAFTGEVSAPMLVAAGCTHVIIGHWGRRKSFAEPDDRVTHRLKAAIPAKLSPVVCGGEVLQGREAGLTKDVLR